VLYRFTSDVTNEQKAEINRMTALLRGLSPDPRATLKAGFLDAGQAASNMKLISSLPKPTGFFDPSNPGGLPLRLPTEKQDGDARKPEQRMKPAAAPRSSASRTPTWPSPATYSPSATIRACSSTVWATMSRS
jgi:hypothetical protein